jgi:C-terminal processing protease CtpA/Prc
VSCEKNNSETNNTYVNKWILSNMKDYYYWNRHIPSNPNMSQNPENFFYSILYKYKQLDGDRFSWIQENYLELLESLSGINSGDIGFEYILYRFANSNKVYGEVLYTKPNTTAKAQGVQRGNVFYKIDGTELDLSNYQSLLGKTSQTITFADPVFNGNVLSYANERNITITKVKYAENPVFLDSIYEINGKKTGYLIYNFFASDNGDKSYVYDLQVNNIFGKFKAAGVNNLVVDLRYNSGGSTISAQHIASMIVNHLNTNNIFYILQYNSNIGSDNAYFTGKITDKDNTSINANINNIGNNLQKVCFITSKWSASASEMLINGLKPFMASKIAIVGDTTVGKSFASISIYEKNDPKNKWGMQPLVAVFTNGSEQQVPATGFVPNYLLQESSIRNKKQLGDINEDLLKAALGIISGTITTQSQSMQSKIERNEINTSIDKKAYSNQTVLDSRK